jgi:hypothetical protein
MLRTDHIFVIKTAVSCFKFEEKTNTAIAAVRGEAEKEMRIPM